MSIKGTRGAGLRLAAWGLGAALALVLPHAAMAQASKDQPITLIYPFPPGGGGDAAIRLLADGLQAELQQPVIVVNKAGGSGMLGLQSLLAAEPDGLTFAALHNGLTVVRQIVTPDLTAVPGQDIQPVSILWEGVSKIAANPEAPFKTIDEMIAYAKSHPGDLTLAMGGMGSTDHISAQGLVKQAGLDINLVSYNGSVAAIQAAVSGEVMAVISAVSLTPQVSTGQLRPLAVATSEPSSIAPDWPALAQAGLADVKGLNNWMGLYAPQGTPADVVSRLNTAIAKVYGAPDLSAKLSMLAGEPVAMSPEQITAKLVDEIAHNRDLVVDLGIEF